MASWIGATPAQRWHQYQKPADKRLVAESDDMERAWVAKISAMLANRTERKHRRRIRAEIQHLRNYRASVAQARQRLAEFA